MQAGYGGGNSGTRSSAQRLTHVEQGSPIATAQGSHPKGRLSSRLQKAPPGLHNVRFRERLRPAMDVQSSGTSIVHAAGQGAIEVGDDLTFLSLSYVGARLPEPIREPSGHNLGRETAAD